MCVIHYTEGAFFYKPLTCVGDGVSMEIKKNDFDECGDVSMEMAKLNCFASRVLR